MIRSGLGPLASPVLGVTMQLEGELVLVLRVEWSGRQIYGDGWVGRFSMPVERRRVVQGLKVLQTLEQHLELLQALVVHEHTVHLQGSYCPSVREYH